MTFWPWSTSGNPQMPVNRNQYKDLARAAFNCPLIDNHTHPLLKESQRDVLPFHGWLTEAQGEHLSEDVAHSLHGYRATRQLSKLYQCENVWEAVRDVRKGMDYSEICKSCMTPGKFECLLLDDLLDDEGRCESVEWHNQFTSSPCKRILRIEVAAQHILKNLFVAHKNELSAQSIVGTILSKFTTTFQTLLNTSALEENVVGFKSLACYRTGLDISTYCSDTELVGALEAIISIFTSTEKLKLATKVFNDMLVRMALKVAGDCGKPIQFHTGLGDSDLDLVKANPALMQPVIKAYPNTKIILLHASYPFTQEAGYLTAVYKNVYLDFGEIWPFVSASGQRNTIRQLFELCPISKVICSTDAHFWPETYYLGSLQARETLYDVLSECIDRDELSEAQAVSIVEKALFDNANRVYNLNLVRKY